MLSFLNMLVSMIRISTHRVAALIATCLQRLQTWVMRMEKGHSRHKYARVTALEDREDASPYSKMETNSSVGSFSKGKYGIFWPYGTSLGLQICVVDEPTQRLLV